MPIRYSEDEYRKALGAALCRGIDVFYREDCIAYKGECDDTGRVFAEVGAEYLMGKADLAGLLAGIKPRRRDRPYFFAREGQSSGGIVLSSRQEEHWVRDWAKNQRVLGALGRANFYQMPLDAVASDGFGPVDLVVTRSEFRELVLVEVKVGDNQENLLRPILEIETYSRSTLGRHQSTIRCG